jgi:hypothetical protein
MKLDGLDELLFAGARIGRISRTTCNLWDRSARGVSLISDLIITI